MIIAKIFAEHVFRDGKWLTCDEMKVITACTSGREGNSIRITKTTIVPQSLGCWTQALILLAHFFPAGMIMMMVFHIQLVFLIFS
jgi:hypothetical protein